MYQVIISRSVAEMIRQAMNDAIVEGKGMMALKSLRWIRDELASDPNRFGESREHYASAQLQGRVAFVTSLRVHFAVHESSQVVFVSRVGWTTRRAN